MASTSGLHVVCNGEIYNHVELRAELDAGHAFQTLSDTEVILHGYDEWGESVVEHLFGMFAFALWDGRTRSLTCARDRFGMKPFYWTVHDGVLTFASEIKALLPFLPEIESNPAALREYLTFQFCVGSKTLFKGVHQLPPGHLLSIRDGRPEVHKYWDLQYNLDWSHRSNYFENELRERMGSSIDLHLRSDVPVGAYVSGGLDSGIISTIAASKNPNLHGFTGVYALGADYDESRFAQSVADHSGFTLHRQEIVCQDFIENIENVIYHLDEPVAGPGAFSQYMVAKMVRDHCKVVLGGQGGDEIFGGYVRYLIAYFEQCFKASISGTANNGNFIVSYESILPNLTALRGYEPMLQEFWRDGLFGPMDERYFRLVDRSLGLENVVHWESMEDFDPLVAFREIFNAENIEGEAYFDRMNHFDLKTLLPALLHVEDRMSMAHGVESRLPFLDHRIVELAATIPADSKFKDGKLKRLLHQAFAGYLPADVAQRNDKMGFPTPFLQWSRGPARDFVRDIMSTQKARQRDYVDNDRVLQLLDNEPAFGRSFWGMFSIEIWQQQFHDRAADYRSLMAKEVA
jgi:asparagine synthase (glutamine-hydrolysing)